MLKAYIGGFGVKSSEVDDLAQRTCILLYNKWETLEPDSNHGAYIRTLAKGIVRNEIAKSKNRTSLIEKNMTSLMLQYDEASPIEGIMGAEQSESDGANLRNCIDSLPTHLQGILKARYWEGKNSKQIAQLEGKSASTVRKILMKIKRTLRECITSINEQRAKLEHAER